jgi:hypothetical protein
LVFASAELQRAQRTVDFLDQRIAELRTEQRAPARVVLRYTAIPPAARVHPRYRKAAVASLGGFCLPFVLTGLWVGVARLRRLRRA